MERTFERWALGILGGWLGAACLVWAFFSRRSQTFDDLGLFNAPYMYLHYGVLTYPAHGQFDTMTVHPPTHYWVLGMLMRAGLEPFYAEAVPPLTLMFLAIGLIWSSNWPTAIKSGLLVGLSVSFVSVDFVPRMRPETHLSVAWYTALLALESARTKGWALGRLFLGGTLLTYASTMHYPVAPAGLGVLVYVGWVVREKGLHHAARELAALLGGPLIVGVTYLGMFVIPQWHEIAEFITSADRTGGPAASIHEHLRTYDWIYTTRLQTAAAKVVFVPLRVGIPVILIAVAVLAARQETRGLAFASLPYPLFLLLGVRTKYWQTGYYMPELMLYCAAVGVAFCLTVRLLAASISRGEVARPLAVVTTAGLLHTTLGGADVLESADVASMRHLQRHETTVARAAARRTLGDKALIGSRNAVMFYASGATHYLDVSPDLLWTPKPPHDLAEYFGRFDALVEHPSFSHWTWNERRESLVTWYLNGTLKLRGFFFSSGLSHLFLNIRGVDRIEGHGRLPNGSLVRFVEASDGAYSFVALRCDGDPVGALNIGEILRADYGLPGVSPTTPGGWLVTFVGPAKVSEDSSRSVPQQCVVHQQIQLHMEYVDYARLSQTVPADPPIRFFADLESAVDSRHGPELAIQVNEERWPDVVRFIRGPKVGEVYRLGSGEGQILFRASGDARHAWHVHKYGWSGGLKPKAAGLHRDDQVLAYTGHDPRDHLTTPFLEAPADTQSLVLFAMWVKGDRGKLPLVYLQDDSFSRLATAREIQEGPEGWRLLAGWWTRHPGSSRLRLVVAHHGRGTCLLDKIVILMARDSN